MQLVFIYGLPATGKHTVAKHLAELIGFKLFHNHLAVDLLLSVFDFGSAPFVALREEIWLSVFRHACTSHLPGLVFTFAPENTVRPGFIQAARDVVTSNGGTIEFVELQCPLSELKRRIDSPSRREFQKLTSVALFDQLYEAGVFDTSNMPPPLLAVDTSLHDPEAAAATIAHALIHAQTPATPGK
jgi:hypothetical protein